MPFERVERPIVQPAHPRDPLPRRARAPLSPARLPFDDWFRPGEPRSLIPPSGEGLAGEGSAELGKFVLAYGEEIASC